MIWNEATRPGKTDHWGSYPHERRALFEFLSEKNIRGVILVGGDVHRSRVLRHDTKDLAGYDIYELITSPMHGSIIETANAPHPGLIKDMGSPNTFMLLEVEQSANLVKSLQARFLNSSGEELFRIGLLD
jgi:alkaline phosphatase D